MLYTTIGTLFIISFGFELGYGVLFLDEAGWKEMEPLQGHPVRFNLSGHIIPVVNAKAGNSSNAIKRLNSGFPFYFIPF